METNASALYEHLRATWPRPGRVEWMTALRPARDVPREDALGHGGYDVVTA